MDVVRVSAPSPSGQGRLAAAVRYIAGATVLGATAIAVVFLAVNPPEQEPRLSLWVSLLGALALGSACFLPVWRRLPRDAFVVVIAGQSALLALFLFSIGRYHPWHAYWMLVMVLAGATLGYRALAAALVVTVLSALSPVAYGGVFGSTLSSALNYWVEVPGYVVAGGVTYILVSTLRRETAEKEAVEQANSMKAAFVTAVSHELRSPLTTVQGYAELLSRQEGLAPESRSMASQVHRSALQMGDLVRDLHDLSLMEAGRMSMAPAPQRLHAAVAAVLEELRGRSGAHALRSTVPPDLPPVLADPGRLRQVLTNLVDNAIKYSPGGGVVEVSARHGGGEVVVSVRDEGIGIPLEEQRLVFDRFFRGQGEVRRLSGTGLGLSICQQIVAGHGGRIWVESAPGQGSTFLFTLPKAQQVYPTPGGEGGHR